MGRRQRYTVGRNGGVDGRFDGGVAWWRARPNAAGGVVGKLDRAGQSRRVRSILGLPLVLERVAAIDGEAHDDKQRRQRYREDGQSLPARVAEAVHAIHKEVISLQEGQASSRTAGNVGAKLIP